MNKFDDSESGISPYTLMLGSDSVKYFEFPKGTVDHATASKFLKTLDNDLEESKKQALALQSKQIEARTQGNVTQNLFQAGDFDTDSRWISHFQTNLWADIPVHM